MKRAALFVLPSVLACAAAVGPAAARTTASCPDLNAPNELVLVGGTPQTAQLDTPFAQPFAVALANTNSCPVTSQTAGTAITFIAPSSGASGTFASSGSSTATVGADATGSASAPQFTANGISGYYAVVATSAYGTVTFALANTAGGLPFTITPTAPASSSAVAGARYAEPLSVTVRDANGNPVGGAAVTFAFVPGGSGASASFDGGAPQVTVRADASGVATSPRFSANDIPGRFFAAASVDGIVEPIEFSLDNLPGKSSTLDGLLPVKQTAVVGTSFARRLAVRLRDGNGRPVPGATVTFSIGGAAGSASASFADGGAQATATTDARGVARSPRVAANTVAGAFSVTATAPGVQSALFAFRNRPAAVSSVAAGAGSGESTAVGARFPIRIAVTVTDRYGNLVRGATVTFTAPRGGATGRFGRRRIVRVRTDADGVAVAPAFVAGGEPGGYVVRAGVGRHAAAFALFNEPRG
ncbi:MAG TPA: hypothetical protein VFA97_11305 [Gaiellaceae bacterium]|nr:hypothetical protein [Gaiellaceae bacterium]